VIAVGTIPIVFVALPGPVTTELMRNIARPRRTSPVCRSK
jgi:hypothetical protein